MAGHSKWANIKHRKGAQDKRRSKVFSKAVKDIMIAAKMGGADVDANPRLRLAIAKAKAVSLPKDNLQRAILKGAGLLDGEGMEEITYEGYGPGGVALMIECLTDNRNRTAPEVRHAFSKRGQTLGTSGSSAHSYHRVGSVLMPAEGVDEDELMEAAMEHGGDDILADSDDASGDDILRVVCEIDALEGLREGLEAAGFPVSGYGLWWQPAALIPVAGRDAEKLLDLIGALEDLEDTQTVYANFEISDEEMERIASL